MLQKLLYFIKYHNAFSIGVMVVFVGFSATLAASPEVREAFISSQDVFKSVDNSYILNTNPDNFNFFLQINNIKEDEENYYIIYTYTPTKP